MLHASLATGLISALLSLGAAQTAPATKGESEVKASPKSIFDFTVQDIDGQDVPLSKYRGNVLLIVNVASK